MVSEINDFQKEPFFIKNSKGKWTIKFEQEYSFDTRLEEVNDGVIIAYITSVGEKSTIVIPIKKSFMGIEFDSEKLNCELNRLSIRSPFIENYLQFL